MSSGPDRAVLAIERASRVAPWVAFVLACVAIVLVARARSATCLSLVAAPSPDIAASALASVAVPGPRHDHESKPSHEFDRELGAVPRCASEPLSVDRYGMFANDLELRQAPGGTYVLSNARGIPYLSFRAEPTGHRVGLAPLWVALGALGLALAALRRWRAAREKRALLLVVVSLVASLGVVGSVLASP